MTPERSDRGLLGVRPEHLRLCSEEDALMVGRVELVEHLGEVTIAYLSLPDETRVTVKFERTRHLERGQLLPLTADVADLHAFDASGSALTLSGETGVRPETE